MQSNLPIGIDSFRKIREEGKYYVDKTLMIRDFIQYGDEVALITRPRRFGKTLNMTMLHLPVGASDKLRLPDDH